MIRIKKVSLEGFRSFGKEQTLRFGKAPSFNLMTGKNDHTPRLGANAVGKSSLWDGITWVLYGKTPRGLKAGDIANWNDDNLTGGVVVLHAHGTDNIIRRTWKPNTLTLQGDGEPETVLQQRIDELIGLTYEGFIATILMGQFNRFFFDLSPTEKLQVFSDALGLNYWIDRADQARKHANTASEAVTKLERTEAAHQASIQSLTEHRDPLKIVARDHAKNRDDHIHILTSFIEQTEPDYEKSDRQLQGLERQRKRLLNKLDQRQRKAIRYDDEVRELERQQDQTQFKIRHQQREDDRLQANVNQFDEADTTCPVCGNEMDQAHAKKEKNRLQAEYQESGVQLLAMKTKLIQLTKIIKTQSDKRMKYADGIQRIDRRLTKVREQERISNKNTADLKLALDQRRITLANLKAQTNPHQDQLDRLEKDLAIEQHKLKQARHDLDASRQQHRTMEYLSKACKDVRLWLIEEAVAQLEVEVGNSLTQLGLEGWKVKCTVERETKQGKITRGFNVWVQSPDSGKKLVKWESWCGGETQRLRIAGAIGLQRLILERNGIHFPLEIWDEPTAHLSEEGVVDLLQFFEARSREENRMVWIIDHRSLKAGNFDQEVRIVRTDQGSMIEPL